MRTVVVENGNSGLLNGNVHGNIIGTKTGGSTSTTMIGNHTNGSFENSLGKEQGLGIIPLPLLGLSSSANSANLVPSLGGSGGGETIQGITTGMLTPQRGSVMSRSESSISLLHPNVNGNGGGSPPLGTQNPNANGNGNGNGNGSANGTLNSNSFAKILGRLGGEDS